MLARQTGIGGGLVRVDLGFTAGMVGNEALQGGCVGAADHLGPHLPGGTVLDADNRSLADGSAPGPKFLVGMLVSFLAADVSLVRFNGTVEWLL